MKLQKRNKEIRILCA